MHFTLSELAQRNLLSISLIDVKVPFKESNRWLNLNLARVTLASQVEHDHRDAEELGVTSDVGRHWHLGLLSVRSSKVLEPFRWMANRRNWNVFHDQVSVLKVWLRVQRAEKDFKLLRLSSRDLSLTRLNSIVSLLIS